MNPTLSTAYRVEAKWRRRSQWNQAPYVHPRTIEEARASVRWLKKRRYFAARIIEITTITRVAV